MTFRPSPPTRCSSCHRPLLETMEEELREASCPYGHESWLRTPFGLWIEAPPRPMALTALPLPFRTAAPPG